MAPVIRTRSESARRVGRSIERPPAHWSLLALLVCGLLLLLVAAGIPSASVSSGTNARSVGPPALRGSAAIWRVHGDRLAPFFVRFYGRDRDIHYFRPQRYSD